MNAHLKRAPHRGPMRPILLVLALSLPCTMAAAEPSAPPPRAPSAKYMALDADHDGYISRAEARKQADLSGAFEDADINHDGRLDTDEFARAESIMQSQATAQYIDDTLVTTKVKALLLKELQLKSTDVSVQTLNGKVLLSGFVDSDQDLKKIVQVASSVAGVVAVRNGLVVR